MGGSTEWPSQAPGFWGSTPALHRLPPPCPPPPKPRHDRKPDAVADVHQAWANLGVTDNRGQALGRVQDDLVR